MAEAKAGAIYFCCSALYHCGYSTDPGYPEKLRGAIEEYGLTQYDITPPVTPAEAEEAA
jgi:flagellum-specific peptidoglycan hydrolase FlgJ